MSDWTPDFSRAVLERVEVGFGHTMFLCWEPTYPCPIGLVWGTMCGIEGKPGQARFDVMGSYVPELFRRKGVRSWINDEMLRLYDVELITSQAGSREGGRAFMMAYGYVREKSTGLWVYKKKRGQKR